MTENITQENGTAPLARGVAEYKSVNLGSATKEELVAMLYETATRSQIKAKDAFERGATNDARKHLRLARDIIGELVIALDHQAAPELSGNLARLYSWLLREIGKAGLEKDPARLDPTIRVTRNLLDGWAEAFRAPASR